jgi:hypothetical protein
MSAIIQEYYTEVTLKNNTRYIPSIKIEALMDSVHNSDITSDMVFLSSETLSLPNVSQTRSFSKSPIKGNHKPTERANGLAKKCGQECPCFWKSLYGE